MAQRHSPGRVSTGVAGVLIAAAFATNVAAQSRHLWPDPRDFAVRYVAAKTAEHHRDPYNAYVLRQETKRVEGDTYVEQGTYVFLDPPPVAALFRVIALAPLRTAAYMWFAASVVASAVIAWCATTLAGIYARSRGETAAILTLGMSFAPARYGVGGIQLDVVFGAFALVATVFARRRHAPAAVGFASVIGALKPQTAALPLAGELVRRRVNVIAAAVVLLALSALTAAATPSVTWPHWIHAVTHGQNDFPVVERIALAAMLGAQIVLWAPHARRVTTNPTVAFAATSTIAVSIFGLVHFNPFSAVLLAVPFALVIRAATEPAGAALRYATAIVVALFAGGALQPSTTYGGAHAAVFPITGIALLAAAVIVASRELTPYALVALGVNGAVVAAGLTANGTRVLTVAATLLLTGLVTRRLDAIAEYGQARV